MLKRLYTSTSSILSRLSKREGQKNVKQTQILDDAVRLYASTVAGLSAEEIEALAALPPLIRAKKPTK